MANNAVPDQLVSSDLHCLQRQGISGFSGTRIKKLYISLSRNSVSRLNDHVQHDPNGLTGL